jgi:hypothetical protein
MDARVWTRPAALAVAIALVGTASSGFAQTPGEGDENHSSRHPKAATEAPAASAQPAETPKGMMSQDGSGGMMMGRDMKDMMSMMRDMMNTMMSAQSSNVEARIASLKTELNHGHPGDAVGSLRRRLARIGQIHERHAPEDDVVRDARNAVGTTGSSGGDAVGASDVGEIAQGSAAAALRLLQRRAEKDRRRHDDRAHGHDVIRH